MKINKGFRQPQKACCPVCKGFGNTVTRARRDQECVCKGYGSVWIIDKSKGKYRAMWAREYFYH